MSKFVQLLKWIALGLSLSVLFSIVCVGQQPTAKAQPRPTPPKAAARVNRVTLGAVAPAGKPCPVTVELNGTITTNGAVEVKYTWLSSDNSKWPESSINFAKAGTEKVNTTWQLGKTYAGWVQLKILSPNSIVSPRANFKVTCGGAAGGGRVTRATLAAVLAPGQGCPRTVNFNGTITTNGAAEVKYTWVSFDGGTWPEHTINVARAGTERVTENRQVPATETGWMQLKVLSPNAVMSPRANYRVTCPAKK